MYISCLCWRLFLSWYFLWLFLREREWIYTICSVYLYMYFPGDPINMGGTRNHIDRFWPPHIFVCSCPKPGPRFPLLDVEVFLCSIIWDQRWLCSLCVSYYYWWQYRPSLFKLSYINVDRYKHTLEKKWQSRMDNPEKLVTLGTQDDPKKIINKHRKLKIWATLTPPKPHPPKKNTPEMSPDRREG